MLYCAFVCAWLAQVDHFSKYKLVDDDDSESEGEGEDAQGGQPKRKKVVDAGEKVGSEGVVVGM